MRAERLLAGAVLVSLAVAWIMGWLAAVAVEEQFPRGADSSMVLSDLPQTPGLAADIGEAAQAAGVQLSRVSAASGEDGLETVFLAPPGAASLTMPDHGLAGAPAARTAPWSDAVSLRGQWVAWGDEASLRQLYGELNLLGIEPEVLERSRLTTHQLASVDRGFQAAQWVLLAAVMAVGALTASGATRRAAVAEVHGASPLLPISRMVGWTAAWGAGGLLTGALALWILSGAGRISTPATEVLLQVVGRGAVLTFLAGAVGILAGSQFRETLLERMRGARPHRVVATVAAVAAVTSMALVPVTVGQVGASLGEGRRLSDDLAIWEQMPPASSPGQYAAEDSESPEVGWSFRRALTDIDAKAPILLNVASTPCDFGAGGRDCLIVNREYVQRLRPEVSLHGEGPWLLGPEGTPPGREVLASAQGWISFQAGLACAERSQDADCTTVPSLEAGTYPTAPSGWPVLRQGGSSTARGLTRGAGDAWVLVLDESAPWVSGNFLSAAMSRSELLFLGDPATVQELLAQSPVKDRVSPAVDTQLSVLEARHRLTQERHRNLALMAVLVVIELATLMSVAQVVTLARRRRLFVGFLVGVAPWRRHLLVLGGALAATGLATAVAVSRGVLVMPWGLQILLGQGLVVLAVVGATALVVERGLTTSVLKEG